MRLVERYNEVVLGNLEKAFYRWGKFVAHHPWPVIGTTFTITTLCSLGFLLFRIQYATDELWIPSTSPFKSNKEWKNTHFKKNTRYENIMFSGENVLTPAGLQQMYRVHERLMQFQTNGSTFQDMCFKLPIEELFYQGKNPRTKKHKTTTRAATTTTTETTTLKINTVDTTTDDESDTDYYDDIWDDYFDEAPEESEEDTVPTEETATKKPVDNDDYVKDLPRGIYCDLVTTLDKRCFELSLLEIWDFDGEIIADLTQQEILDAVNTLDESPWFFSKRNYSDDLGGITRNSTGHIIGAKTTWVQFLLEVPEDAENVAPGGIGFEFEVADENSLQMEQFMIDVCEEESGMMGFEVLAFTARSFNDVSFATIFFDVWKMLGGYVIMFVYTVLMLGRLNKKEVRLYLSGAGIFSCILGLGAAFGIMFLLGMEYNQTHHILPFIAIGIGIDDMFVIMECWYNLSSDPTLAAMSIPERMGRTMRHAGVSVTVTSITDVFAFGIGACTIMPGLRAFCVSAAICIALIFCLQVSWFVAWVTLDQQRIEQNKHGIFPCKTIEKSEEIPLEDIPVGKQVMNKYSKLFDNWIFKLFVIIVSCGLLSFGVFGSVKIIQRFDPNRMLPADSYLSHWIALQQELYPSYGFAVWVMTGPLELEDLPKLDRMVSEFDQISEDGPGRILRDVETWWHPFKTFLAEEKNMTWTEINTMTSFQTLLSDFLFDLSNAKQQYNFKFNGSLVCNQPTPAILATQQKLQYGMSSSLPLPSEYLPAKAAVDNIIASSNISSKAFATSPIYQAWETDSIISLELWRNLALALMVVGIVSFTMLANFSLCLMVMACVMLTLVDLVGTLHFWDVTIDVISCVNIVLATGLCVDYSVHIAHAFSVAEGTRTERTKTALVNLGPAILNGGVTTFLAVIILPFSQSHVFKTFFKIFGLTVLYGVFHGLVFLPALLSTFGPHGKSDKDTASDKSSGTSNNNSSPSTSSSSSTGSSPSLNYSTKASGNINPGFSD